MLECDVTESCRRVGSFLNISHTRAHQISLLDLQLGVFAGTISRRPLIEYGCVCYDLVVSVDVSIVLPAVLPMGVGHTS